MCRQTITDKINRWNKISMRFMCCIGTLSCWFICKGWLQFSSGYGNRRTQFVQQESMMFIWFRTQCHFCQSLCSLFQFVLTWPRVSSHHTSAVLWLSTLGWFPDHKFALGISSPLSLALPLWGSWLQGEMVRTVGRSLSQPQPRRLLSSKEPTSRLSPGPSAPRPQWCGKSLGGCPTE